VNIFCAGMSRSGGTLQYQLVVEIAGYAGIAKYIGFLALDEYRKASAEGRFIVGKSEEPQPWMLDEVRAGRAKVFTIHRDPRQICVSLMRFYKSRNEYRNMAEPEDYFEWVLQGPFSDALRWFKTWTELPEGSVFIDCYEDRHPVGWEQATRAYAEFLGIDMPDYVSFDITTQWMLDENYKRQKTLDRWIDGLNLLTKEHIGLTWADDLTAEQIKRVESIAKSYMEKYGYEPAF